MRLIDADALKEALADVKAHYDCFDEDEKKFYEAYSKAVEILDIYLDDSPAIDAVEVVRCKDCTLSGHMGWCSFWGEDVDEEGFCSYGERRTDE